MKLLQVTDLHLVSPGETLMGLDPLQRLDACLADIEASHADADLVLITGDLSDTGGLDSYDLLKTRLARFSRPVRLLLGNHDDRANFTATFPDQVDSDGFAQTAIDLEGNRILVLDTQDDGHVAGRLCERRLAWIEARLAEAAGWPVYIFMHHPAGPVGMPSLDPIGLLDPAPFFELLKRHGNVRHIFAGHFHRAVSGAWHGIPFSLMRSTNHQTALDFVSTQTSISFEAPAYAVIEARPDVLFVHVNEF